MGIAPGLLVGKPLGVTLFVFLAKTFRLISLPIGATRPHFVGVAVLAGISFTMSLFIGTLAFGEATIVG
jgi:NhaA family Na+:H+ antiporter